MLDNKVKILKTLKEVRVFNDPYRQEILKTLSLLNKPSTAKEVADEMNELPSKVNYHIGILLEYGFITIHHTKIIKGITAKYYNLCANKVIVRMDSTEQKGSEIRAVQDMIAATFDNAKNFYIKQLGKFAKRTKKKKVENRDFINTKNVYMNAEEYKEFVDYMNRLAENKKEGREIYSLFASLIKKDVK